MLPLQQQKSEDKSLLRKYGEHQAKKQWRKLAKKGAKLAAKLAKLAAKKFVLALAKLLAWLAGTIGLPAIGIALCAIIAIVIISLAWSFLLGTGEGLTGEDKKTHDYIIEQANATVDMNSSIERPYRVPEKLIAATIQLDAFTKNDNIKDIIKNMATSLKPSFHYGKYDEWKEKQITVCEDGVCQTGEVIHTENMVQKLELVEYWNGTTSFKYTPHVSPWESKTVVTYKTVQIPVTRMELVEEQVPITKKECKKVLIKGEYTKIGEGHYVWLPDRYEEVCKDVTVIETNTKKVPITVMEDKKIKVETITKTRYQYFTSTQNSTTDYSMFDMILNSYSLGLEDKKLIEANYMFMGGSIGYTDWLMSTGGGGVIGGGYFDGTIIPGAGVPPQFMPFYRSAEKTYGVDWYVLAAIHFVETGFSTHPTMISSSGAVGHLQFMPATVRHVFL